jgi:hypothetical protein
MTAVQKGSGALGNRGLHETKNGLALNSTVHLRSSKGYFAPCRTNASAVRSTRLSGKFEASQATVTR